MTTYEQWSLFWYATSGIAATVTVTVVVVAAALTYKQVREASRARQLQAALAILDIIDSPQHRHARRVVFAHHERIAEFLKEKPSLEAIDGLLKSISEGKVDWACLHS